MRQAAKDERGFGSPSDLNYFFQQAEQEEFQSILMEYSIIRNKQQRYNTFRKRNYNSLQSIQDDLAPLFIPRGNLTSSTANNIFDKPNDYAYYIDIEYNGINLPIVDVSKRGFYNNAFDAAPNLANPIAIFGDTTIEVLPSAITSDVKLSYYKVPQGVSASTGQRVSSQPTWAYNVVSGNSIYNASNSVDFELPKHLEYRLAARVLNMMGIEIRDVDLYQMAKAEETQNIQEATS